MELDSLGVAALIVGLVVLIWLIIISCDDDDTSPPNAYA